MEQTSHKQLETFLGYLRMAVKSNASGSEKQNNNIPAPPSSSASRDSQEGGASKSSSGLSGYNSELSTPGETEESTTDGGELSDSAGYFPGDSSTGGFSSDLDLEEIEDMNERIEFLRAKQEILEKANIVIFDQEYLMTAQTASHPNSVDQYQQEQPEGGSIWTEARNILNKLGNNSNSPTGTCGTRQQLSAKKLPGKGPKQTRQRHAGAPRPWSLANGSGNMSGTGVERICSEEFDKGNFDPTSSTPSSEGMKSVSFSLATSALPSSEGHWMAQALIRTAHFQQQKRQSPQQNKKRKAASPHDLTSSSWKVLVPSPRTSIERPLSFLVPPPGYHLWNSIDLRAATAPQTTSPRLVTQATPPFLVVYANRAFLQLLEHPKGEEDSALPCILGRPVESLIQVMIAQGSLSTSHSYKPTSGENLTAAKAVEMVEDISSSSASFGTTVSKAAEEAKRQPYDFKRKVDLHDENCFFESILVSNGRMCRIQIVPVVDRSSTGILWQPIPKHRTRGHTKQDRSSSPSFDAMSNVMVEVLALQDLTHLSQNGLVRPQALRMVRQPTAASSLSDEDASEDRGKAQILGTVG